MEHNAFIAEKFQRRLKAYEAEPQDAAEHHGREQNVLGGAYSYRQVAELIQNAADAISAAAQNGGNTIGRIDVGLRGNRLYAANNGDPFTRAGIDSILNADLSPKVGNLIGRFGIGFKSLLKFGREVLVLSRTACFRFDPERCRSTIREHLQLPVDAPAPGMRLAWACEPMAAQSGDPILAEHSQWAATVIRAEISEAADVEQIAKDLKAFRAELLLFITADVMLSLRHESLDRVIQRERMADGVTVLEDGDERSRWRLFGKSITIVDEAAKRDATNLHDRAELPITWAVPLDAKAKNEAGTFWVFFPTLTRSLVPGILSAPWKVGSDRQNLMQGPFNSAMLKAAAELVAESLPQLWQADDPGVLLDYLPSAANVINEVAAPLVNALWLRLRGQALVTDGLGQLKLAKDVRLHPTQDDDLLAMWASIATDAQRGAYVHASCMKGDRVKRLSYLRGPRDVIDPGGVEHWLGHLRCQSVDDVTTLLSLVIELERTQKAADYVTLVRTHIFLLNEQREWVKLARLVHADPPPGFSCVLANYWLNDACRELLKKLGIEEWDERRWGRELENALSKSQFGKVPAVTTAAWKEFWHLLAGAPPSAREGFLGRRKAELKAICRDGSTKDSANGLFLGSIISIQDAEHVGHAGHLIDTEFHAAHLILLQAAGFSEQPAPGWKLITPPRTQWELTHYSSLIPKRNDFYIVRHDPCELPRAFELLVSPGLSAVVRERVANLLLARLSQSPRAEPLRPTKMRHSGGDDGTVELPNPLSSWLWRYARIEVALQSLPIWLIRQHLARKSLALLPSWPALKVAIEQLADGFGSAWKVPGCHEEMQAIGAIKPTEGSPDELDRQAHESFWQGIFVLARNAAGPEAKLVYDEAAHAGYVPDRASPTAGGPQRALPKLLVTDSSKLLALGQSAEMPCLLLAPATVTAWLNRGAQALDPLLELVAPAAEPVLLLDIEPQLQSLLREEAVDATVMRCGALRLQIGEYVQPELWLQWKGDLYLNLEGMRSLSWQTRTRTLLEAVHPQGWLNTGDLDAAMRGLQAMQVTEQERFIAEGADLSDKLLRAIGPDLGSLRTLLSELDSPLHPIATMTSRGLADVALSLHGTAVLQQLAMAMSANGLQPPKRWGGDEARLFVSKIGFPAEFATAPTARRDPELWISGPIALGALHDYQAQAIEALGLLWQSRNVRRRAMVSLPTGAGKTRVAVEAAVSHILKRKPDALVLWVVDSDELCEQAVLSFRQVWANEGTESVELRVIRFWGRQGNPTPADEQVPTVIVSTYQTLNHRMDSEALTWLRKPDLLVIDEAHRAIAPSYTGLLEWLDDAKPADTSEPPLLGLSATPFRRDDDESVRLARRFDQRLLPEESEQEGLHQRLLADGILAEAGYRPLPFDEAVTFTAEEQRQIERFHGKGEVPASVLERLASNEARNRMILQYLQASSAHSILLFAASVSHARRLAARLTLMGIGASLVTGDTPPSSRKYFIRQFQEKKLRVLCNFGVLATGFDAPQTDLILIGRPVWSPVMFLQMIGRGLRGPKNGGTQSCEIATVIDNFVGYNGKTAADFFRGLYSNRAS